MLLYRVIFPKFNFILEYRRRLLKFKWYFRRNNQTAAHCDKVVFTDLVTVKMLDSQTKKNEL